MDFFWAAVFFCASAIFLALELSDHTAYSMAGWMISCGLCAYYLARFIQTRNEQIRELSKRNDDGS